jgi:hypothetical protein
LIFRAFFGHPRYRVQHMSNNLAEIAAAPEVAAASSAARSRSVARPPRTRSAVTNGSRQFVTGDARGPWARRWRDLYEQHIDDLGGPDACSEATKAIIRRATAQEVECERLEAGFATAGGATPEALDLHQRVSNTMRRHFKEAGLDRVMHNITPAAADAAIRAVEWAGVETGGGSSSDTRRDAVRGDFEAPARAESTPEAGT